MLLSSLALGRACKSAPRARVFQNRRVESFVGFGQILQHCEVLLAKVVVLCHETGVLFFVMRQSRVPQMNEGIVPKRMQVDKRILGASLRQRFQTRCVMPDGCDRNTRSVLHGALTIVMRDERAKSRFVGAAVKRTRNVMCRVLHEVFDLTCRKRRIRPRFERARRNVAQFVVGGVPGK